MMIEMGGLQLSIDYKAPCAVYPGASAPSICQSVHMRYDLQSWSSQVFISSSSLFWYTSLSSRLLLPKPESC